jgi:hypothetical protein
MQHHRNVEGLPDSPTPRDAEVPGQYIVATDIGELHSRNPSPSHRRPAAQKKATPENGNANALPGRGD